MFIERMIGQKLTVKKLPQAKEIVACKKKRLVEQVGEILTTQEAGIYDALAAEILALGEASSVIAAVLQEAYGKDFDESQYASIQESSLERRK